MFNAMNKIVVVVFFYSLLLIWTEHLIDGLGRANPIEDDEAMVYGYCAVRFLANAEIPVLTSANRNPSSATPVKKSKTLACRLIRYGALPLMILHLQMINEAVKIYGLFEK